MHRMKRDNWVTLGVLAALLVGAMFILYLPQSNKLDEIRSQSASLKTQLEADAKKAAVVPAMVRWIDTMQKRYLGFDRRMPKRKELAAFLREISSILASERLSNQLTEPGNPTREELFHTLPIIMKFQGSYLSLASLLERIDEMERLTRVQKLTIARDPKHEELNIEIQMNIYFTES